MTKTLVGCIKKINSRIETRFFYVCSEKEEITDVTSELCSAIAGFNKRAEQTSKETGKYSLKIPYTYKDGLAKYSFGCGLTHYLQTSLFPYIEKASTKRLSFPLSECNLYVFSPIDVKGMLGCNGVFDSKIEQAILKMFEPNP